MAKDNLLFKMIPFYKITYHLQGNAQISKGLNTTYQIRVSTVKTKINNQTHRCRVR